MVMLWLWQITLDLIVQLANQSSNEVKCLMPLPLADKVDFVGRLCPTISFNGVKRLTTEEATSNSQVDNNEEVFVKGLTPGVVNSIPKVSLKSFSVVNLIIYQPLNSFCVPIEAKSVKVLTEVKVESSFSSSSFCFLVPRGSIMKSSQNIGWSLTTVLHDVNFSAARPATVFRVCGHHPESRPQMFSLRQSSSHFKFAVKPVSLGSHTGWGKLFVGEDTITYIQYKVQSSLAEFAN